MSDLATLTIRLSRDLHSRAKLKTMRERTSLQKVIEDAVKNYVGEVPTDPDFQRQVEIARRGMVKYRKTLETLAK